MTSLNNWPTQAVNKLEKEIKAVSGQKEKAMASAVLAALKDFCLQDAEFAQAVAQGGSFADCMRSVAKGVGSHVSDIEAYGKAVAFYFPGAKIRVQMTIDLVGDAAPIEAAPEVETELRSSAITLSLADFL